MDLLKKISFKIEPNFNFSLEYNFYSIGINFKLKKIINKKVKQASVNVKFNKNDINFFTANNKMITNDSKTNDTRRVNN